MSTHVRSSSGREASTSALPPTTPRRKVKRKSAVPLTSKQYDRMTRQILQIQQATKGARDSGLAEADEEEDDDHDHPPPRQYSHDDPPDIPTAAQVLSTLNINSDAPVDSDSTMAIGHRPDFIHTTTTSTKQTTNHWLQKITKTQPALHRQAGKGPDGIALAAAAAKGLHGRLQPPSDSFAHEASFIFNPLARRVPLQPSKHTQPSTRHHPPQQQPDDNNATADAQPQLPPDDIRLDSMPREVQEAAIMQDLLHVLIGIEGQWITFAPGYDPNDQASQLRGPTYIVHPAIGGSTKTKCYSSLVLTASSSHPSPSQTHRFAT